MAGGGGGGGGGGLIRANGVAVPSSAVPVATKRILQSLKEIVNCPESEIYAMLKECGMDPDETVNRLLSQDTFHEVKSKREKKKEMKETPEFRFRVVNSSSSRGSRVGVGCGGRSTSTQFSSADCGVSRGKPASKKENETNAVPTSSVLGSSMATLARKSTGLSESASTESTIRAIGIDDGISSSSQLSAGVPHNWMGKPGHVSMADIVKMGRPQNKPFSTSFVPSKTPYTLHNGAIPSMSRHNGSHSPTLVLPSEPDAEFDSSQGPVSEAAKISHEVGTGIGRSIPYSDQSLVDESPAISGSTVSETSSPSARYADPSTSSTLHVDEVDLHRNSHLDKIRVSEGNNTGETRSSVSSRSASACDGQIWLDNPEDDFQVDDVPIKTNNSYQSQRHAFEHEVENADVEISSATANLQKLRLHKEELLATSAGDNPAVIIPSHLQVTNAECSHLSFGSFSSSINATFSESYPLKSVQTNSEVIPDADDAPSLDHSESRNLDYYDNDLLQSNSNENVASSAVTNTRNYDIALASQPDISISNALDAAQGLQFNLPSSSGYSFSTTTQQNAAAYMHPLANPQMFTNSLPSSLLAPNIQPLREFDLPFSPSLSTQSTPTKYNTILSTTSGPTISPPEVEPRGFSTHQQTPQTLLSTSIPAGPGLPQHLPIHPYTQPTLPLGHFANMISYPLLPQSYTYLPSAAFQQAYTGSGPLHQSPAAIHSAGMKCLPPHLKICANAVNVPHTAVASGYGGLGSSSNIPGGFPLNHSTPASSTTLGFDEALSLHYKEANHYLSHQQTENSWMHGAGLRTSSVLPSSSFYSLRGQSQLGGYRQQPSQYGAMGYSNMYHSQAGASQEHQNPGEGNLNGSQGLQSQQSHQIWQHDY